jgi:DNA-nicking Smr family endonuclease
MTRRKKRKKQSYGQKASKKKPVIFNPAFDGLISLNKRDKKMSREQEKLEPPQPKEKPDETRIFLEAMSDDDDLEVMAHLSDLVSGIAEMDFTFSDEYIEGSVHGFSRKLMKRLKKGQIPIQDYVDLHGLTKQKAETRIRDFLIQSQQLGLRCVLVVHGRGLNSEDHIPVLKERLPVWLTRGPVKKSVLAFSTAMPYDGGTGAIYVLLRKPKTGP